MSQCGTKTTLTFHIHIDWREEEDHEKVDDNNCDAHDPV
jgi:hypothetical protein